MKKKLFYLVVILISPLFQSNILGQTGQFYDLFIGNPNSPAGYLHPSADGTAFAIQARQGYSKLRFAAYNPNNTNNEDRFLEIYKESARGVYFHFPETNITTRFTTTNGLQSAFSFATGGRGITDNQTDLYISSVGNVGIGAIADSEHKLMVSGSAIFHLSQAHMEIKQGKNNDPTLIFSGGSWNRINAVGDFAFFTNNQGDSSDTPQLLIAKQGQVCIGGTVSNISPTNLGKYNLFVNKGILSEDFAIGPRSSWADHVLEADYKLMDLKEVESYISEHSKLPDIPSAAEVQENGYSLHEMNVKLLQKIEELTLYVIGQEKEINKLKNMLEVK